MNTFDLTLDLSKQVSMEPLRLRQGDKSGTTVRATVYDHGELVSGSYTARIAMRHPGTGATYYRETGTFSNGVATFTIDEQYAATVTGRTTGYVQLLQGSTVIASTADFPVVILRDATEGAVPGEVYDSAIEDALAELDEATGRISVMVQEQVAEELAAHPEWTTTVTDGSVTDAKLVQTGGILSRVDRLMYRLDNLLTGDTGEQEVAVVADAAATPVAGLSVYGRSVQDGTPTPDAPVPIESVEGQLYRQTYYAEGDVRTVNGVTITTLADGTFSCSGTSTAIAYTMGTDDRCYVEVPAGTYMALSSHNVRVATKDAAGGASTTIATNVSAPYVFTIDTAKLVKVEPVIPTAVTLSDTHVWTALFAGGDNPAWPFVPYGHVGLLARGRNWLDPSIARGGTQKGITVTASDADGWFTISGTSTSTSATVITMWGDNDARIFPPGVYTLLLETEGTPFVGNVRLQVFGTRADSGSTYIYGAGAYTMDYTENGIDRIGMIIGSASSGTTVDGRFRLTLVDGTTAPTAYVPYVESVTPVPLGGHVLRSLPDGTRDEVTVDERGHAVLVQRVGEVTLDGSESWSAVSVSGVFNLVLWRQSEGTLISASQQSGLCDRLTWDGSNVAGMADGTFKVGSSGTSEYAFIVNKSLATAAEIKAWLAENPTTITYKLATPVTHDLGYVDPVALTSPDATLQAVTGIATTFRADYERDLNTTLARLEAAIATLA